MKATIESIGKVGSRTNLDGHELVFDQPATVPGGEDRGPSPLDVMAVSVAACAHYANILRTLYLPGGSHPRIRPAPGDRTT